MTSTAHPRCVKTGLEAHRQRQANETFARMQAMERFRADYPEPHMPVPGAVLGIACVMFLMGCLFGCLVAWTYSL